MIPSMGGTQIGPWLERYAAEVPKGTSIVEVGAWLGAGTVHLAAGAAKSDSKVHCYDRWKCTETEYEKAKAVHKSISVGANLLPCFLANLGEHSARVVPHQGDLFDATWKDGKIGLYVDDASKIPKLWWNSMTVFRRHFIPGAIMILMDYHFDEVGGKKYRAQKDYIRSYGPEEFQPLEDRLGGTSAAIFRAC